MSIPDQLQSILETAARVVVLTGAGISAESGVPTFREAQTGLWAEYRPEELATREAFSSDPERVLRWYEWRRDLIRGSQPNPGHTALVQMEDTIQKQGRKFHLITQNVDNLHQLAGSKQLLELHGNIFKSKCFDCGKPAVELESHSDQTRCETCGGLLRPDVVWFGESLPTPILDRAIQASRKARIFFSVGTSAVVQPAASLPHYARENHAFLVEINPDQTPLTPYCDLSLPYPAGDILPELVDSMKKT